MAVCPTCKGPMLSEWPHDHSRDKEFAEKDLRQKMIDVGIKALCDEHNPPKDELT